MAVVAGQVKNNHRYSFAPTLDALLPCSLASALVRAQKIEGSSDPIVHGRADRLLLLARDTSRCQPCLLSTKPARSSQHAFGAEQFFYALPFPNQVYGFPVYHDFRRSQPAVVV